MSFSIAEAAPAPAVAAPSTPPPVQAPSADPCQSCGACCATYRVSFYWAEADALGLDPALTRPLNPWRLCMAGTEQAPTRCQALHGQVGAFVACSVYAARPSPCRELQPGEDKCVRARAGHGLPALPALSAQARDTAQVA